MSSQMIVRISPELKDKVSVLARAEGKSASKVVRDLLEDYVRDRDFSQYIDGLWSRIGQQLKTKEVNQNQIESAIRDIRKRS